MVILAVHVGGDGAADRHETRAGQHEGQEAARAEGLDQVREQHAGLEADSAGRRIEPPDAVEARHRDDPDGPDRSIAIGTAIAARHGAGHDGVGNRRERARTQHLGIDDREAPPAADEGHGSAPAPGAPPGIAKLSTDQKLILR
ncbi:hypothetical protein ABIA09_005153 [Bradyrhizobium yuanmingense]